MAEIIRLVTSTDSNGNPLAVGEPVDLSEIKPGTKAVVSLDESRFPDGISKIFFDQLIQYRAGAVPVNKEEKLWVARPSLYGVDFIEPPHIVVEFLTLEAAAIYNQGLLAIGQ